MNVDVCTWEMCGFLRHSFPCEWQKLDKALESGLSQKKANKEQLFSRWPRQNTAEYSCEDADWSTIQVVLSRTTVAWWKRLCLCLKKKKLNWQDSACSAGFVMGLTVGHSTQSVFAKIQEEKFLSKLSGLKHEEHRVNVYFVIPSALLRLLPSTSALIGEYLLCTPK